MLINQESSEIFIIFSTTITTGNFNCLEYILSAINDYEMQSGVAEV
jgi:hypothetical protein